LGSGTRGEGGGEAETARPEGGGMINCYFCHHPLRGRLEWDVLLEWREPRMPRALKEEIVFREFREWVHRDCLLAVQRWFPGATVETIVPAARSAA
jgi:hypothetical protein